MISEGRSGVDDVFSLRNGAYVFPCVTFDWGFSDPHMY